VAAGNGCAIMPQMAMAGGSDCLGLVRYLPFRDPSPGRMIGFVFQERCPRLDEAVALTSTTSARGNDTGAPVPRPSGVAHRIEWKETLRALDDARLDQVMGGAWPTRWPTCTCTLKKPIGPC
jgi:hypothetical protein